MLAVSFFQLANSMNSILGALVMFGLPQALAIPFL